LVRAASDTGLIVVCATSVPVVAMLAPSSFATTLRGGLLQSGQTSLLPIVHPFASIFFATKSGGMFPVMVKSTT
jgi:hypothetical protein